MWKVIIFCSTMILILAVVLYGVGPSSIVESPDREYDYIIVGAGTAGCVVASRLAENSNAKVLLVEAGSTIQIVSRIPLLAPVVQQTNADWQFKTVSQKFSSIGLFDRIQFLPRGKGLGGSGHINYMIHSFGRPSDYNDWPKGWTSTELEPYFDQVEQLMSINRRPTSRILARAADLYHKSANPFVPVSVSTSQGVRTSSYRTHLQKVWHQPNLHILIDTLVSKVSIDEGNTARGIELIDNLGQLGGVLARKEVILCAGALGSPHLLMLSGVGPQRELKKHNITVRADLPAVGRNLFDHLNMPMYVKLKNPSSEAVSITHENLLTLRTLTDYFFGGTGLLASNGIAGMTWKDDHAVILTAIGTIDKDALIQLSNYRPQIFERLFPTYNDSTAEGYLMLATCLQPKSRGRVRLHSGSVRDHPLLDPNYLKKIEDVKCHVKAMQQVKEIANSPPFVDYGAELHVPWFEECRHYRQDIGSEDFSACLVRIGAITSHHPGGTCQMGANRNTSVVDEKLRVHGINNLRIVDASILPSPISGPPNSVIIAIAEKAAQMIR
ncbi:neither inactivation nor afterpotential protein G [Copidosoma floridanum]|uniref:neither inactivation nor afterpotential protein G n=1 Tax=Copidosoma floridanum TaxID=29053 RepID=UPI0006C9AC5F|nr:neither inactivation nor afterpotential protein G [Copidosoma floridanum]